jgi:hypothetical protein
MGRTCSDCPSPITAQSRTGRCRRCAASIIARSPEHIAKRSASYTRRLLTDPAFRAKKAREIHARNMAARRDPEKAARLLAVIHKNREGLATPQAKAKWLAGRAAAGRKRHETVMAWCPPEYRAEYRFLRLTKKLLAREAKAVILAQLTPFERQMQAVRMGARLINKPVFRRPDYDYTLGGVSEMAI